MSLRISEYGLRFTPDWIGPLGPLLPTPSKCLLWWQQVTAPHAWDMGMWMPLCSLHQVLCTSLILCACSYALHQQQKRRSWCKRCPPRQNQAHPDHDGLPGMDAGDGPAPACMVCAANIKYLNVFTLTSASVSLYNPIGIRYFLGNAFMASLMQVSEGGGEGRVWLVVHLFDCVLPRARHRWPQGVAHRLSKEEGTLVNLQDDPSLTTPHEFAHTTFFPNLLFHTIYLKIVS